MDYNRKKGEWTEEEEGKKKKPFELHLSQNTVNKIIAFVLALGLWAFVAYKVNPPTTQEFQDVPVRLMSMETLVNKNLAVTGDTNYKINVQLRGKRAEVAKVTKADIVATANLVEIGGTGQFPVSVSVNLNVDFPNVEVVKKNFSIEVNVEKLISQKKKVHIQTLGALPDGKALSDFSLSPDEVEVGGAKSEVNNVSFVQASLDISALTERESTAELTLTPVNAAGMTVGNVVLSQDSVEVKAKLLDTKEVPLKVNVTGDPPKGMELDHIAGPEQIQIRGTKDELDGIQQAETVPIDLSKLKEGANTVPLRLKDVQATPASRKNLQAVITMKVIATKEITYNGSEIGIEDLPEGLSAEISTPQIIVTVSGDEATVRSIGKGDIKPYLSLKDATPETVTADVQLRYGVALSGAVTSPSAVAVTVTKNE